MNKNLTKILHCYRAQCAADTPKPCWLRSGAELPNGLNLHGYFLSEIGLGESARLVYKALSTQELNIAACNHDLKGRQNETNFIKITSETAPYNFSLIINGLTGFKGLRRQICKQKYNIAYPFWELEHVPKKYLEYLERYDSIWAPSSFIYNTLKKYNFSSVELVKHPIDVKSRAPEFFTPSGPLKILFYFDFDSFPARKNPEAAIYAFKQAFPNREDVTLTIKTRGNRDLGRRHWLAQQTTDDRRISVIDRLLDRHEVEDLMAGHDVFLSLHRSEGLGLGCAEALAAGKAVIATDYGGSTEFINSKTGFPVKWSRIKVNPKDYVLAENATWADPSIDHAAQLLRSIYDDPMDARERVKNGFQQLVENHSFSVVGRDMVNRLYKKRLMVE